LRLDIYISKGHSNLTRSYIQKLIKNGSITVNGLPSKASCKIKKDDKISVNIPRPKKIEANPENIPLNIIYEDADFIVINKARGMVTHPAPGNWEGTLVNAVLDHCKDLSGIGGDLRPGIVHRLDKDTSGIIIVTKSDFAHKSLAKQLKDRLVKKTYIAVVSGKMKKDDGVINEPIGRSIRDRKKMTVAKSGGREAITRYSVIKIMGDKTIVELYPRTGRTHQLRVHLAHIGHPIVGDKIYNPKKSKSGMMLHAKKIGFAHPSTGKYVEFEAQIPIDMSDFIDML